MSQTGQDKRGDLRKEEEICTWLSFTRDNAIYGTLTADLATGGAKFSALRKVGVNDRVHIAIQLTTSAISCEGKVCWVRPVSSSQFDFGVQFLNLAESDRGELKHHLNDQKQ